MNILPICQHELGNLNIKQHHIGHLKRWRSGDRGKNRGSSSSSVGVLRVLHGQGVDKVLHCMHLSLLHYFGRRRRTEHWVLPS